MAKLRELNLKIGASERLNEASARDILMAMHGAGGGFIYELQKEIVRRIQNQEKFFFLKLSSAVGGDISKEAADQVQNQLNHKFKKTGYAYRVRYSEDKKGLVVVPQADYEKIFGKKERKAVAA